MDARREDTHARVLVQNSGVGVSPDFLPSMFDPFTQADKSPTRQFGGLGLGLAIVKQILTLHGGTVSASSDGQHGTSVVLDFPVPPVLEEPDERVRRCEIGEPGERRLDGVKVLVVDDDADACEAVRLVLQQHGATVETVTSAAEALNRLPQMNPDVLVADLAMPELDGYDLIKELRKRAAGMDLPAVALTAYTDAARDAAIGAGFQQFSSKPIPPGELVMVVKHLSDRRV